MQWIALRLILVGYWAAFALYPLPGADFDYAAVGRAGRTGRHLTRAAFAAHWNKNSNLGLGVRHLVPEPVPARKQPFAYNGGGYATLSFIPTLGTMILGLIAGGVLRSDRAALGQGASGSRMAGVVGLVAGWGLRRARHLPGGQADLDAELGALQRRLVLPVPGRLLRRHRRAGPARLGVPAPGHRHELDRRLLHGSTCSKTSFTKTW